MIKHRCAIERDTLCRLTGSFCERDAAEHTWRHICEMLHVNSIFQHLPAFTFLHLDQRRPSVILHLRRAIDSANFWLEAAIDTCFELGAVLGISTNPLHEVALLATGEERVQVTVC